MAKITLLHNDDEVLDPADSSLRTRGSLDVDGHEKGSWEEHIDGTWTARLDKERLSAASKEELLSLVENRIGGDA